MPAGAGWFPPEAQGKRHSYPSISILLENITFLRICQGKLVAQTGKNIFFGIVLRLFPIF
jgi:hypothetical protein